MSNKSMRRLPSLTGAHTLSNDDLVNELVRRTSAVQQVERPGWYNIARSDSGPTMVTIYDEIGMFGVSAGAFTADLDGIKGDIEMHINSPGGDIYEGLTIYNRLKARKGSVHVVVDGLAASAASFIAMAASPGKLEMTTGSDMMIHNGRTMEAGDAADLRKTADLLDRKTADIAAIYAERTGKPADYWLGLMAKETWFSAEEAVAEGLADGIHGQDRAMKNEAVLPVVNKAPEPVPTATDDGTATSLIDVGALSALLLTNMAQEGAGND